jgi:uncharacterized membrane protein YcaP (DUF421 family)
MDIVLRALVAYVFIITLLRVTGRRELSSMARRRPLIVVEGGKLVEGNLRSERMTLDDVMEEARAQQIESIDEIKWAVLESNGSLSFIKH